GNLLSSTHSEQDNLASLLAQTLPQTRGRSAVRVEAADNSGLAAVAEAYRLVSSGAASTVLVVGVEKMTEFPSAMVMRALAHSCHAQYELVYGATPAGIQALLMRLYMGVFGVDRDALSSWPVLMHDNAADNPYAQLRFRVSKEQVASSMVIADPITLLDSSPVGDGAAAVVLASEEEARSQTDTPVEIASVAHATDTLGITGREDPLVLMALEAASRRAYEEAGISVENIDVLEIHDTTTIMGILELEALGLAPRGRAAAMLDEGRFAPGDRPSVNLSGGLKARGHPVGATGVYQAAEIAMQLRGDFPGRKAPSPETGVAAGLGGSGATAIVVVMRR
ncbi:MAG: acetyl-CoA acetyltransferase, partial [Candidatus Korarchaeota archaeon]|nr:acetyl-CoA acetyltransferase [Candidatus Korarchaeota archaeon]